MIEPGHFLKDEPYPILQGPTWTRPAPSVRGRPFSAASFADILAVTGFSNADELMAMLRAWDGLLNYVRPDVVVAEYAPLLVLATRGRIPTIFFGTGFTVPPANVPQYPALQPKIEPIMPAERILANVQEVQRRRRAPVPPTLPAVLACERRFACTFPEIDPYRQVRREPVIPPLEDLPPVLPPPQEPRFFAYLAADAPGLNKMLGGIVKSGVAGSIFLRHPSPQLKEAVKKTRITLFEEPQPLAVALRDASFVIHHGGAGTSEACLTAGRVQILFPRHLEQSLTAAALRDQGIALVIGRNATEDAVAGAVKQAATDIAAIERAQRLAQTIAARGPRPGVAPIIAACEELLATRRAAI